MRRSASIALSAVVVAACTRYGSIDRSQGFTGNKATVDIRDVPVNGHEVDVVYGDSDTLGELLGIDPEHLYVLENERTVAIPRSSVERVSIKLYTSGATAAGIWTGLGTISTLSHGLYLIITAPIWLATGVPTTASLAATNHLRVEPAQLDRLDQFARFPQGLPSGWPNNRAVPAPPRVEARALDAGAEGGEPGEAGEAGDER
jgi:hypothetical protein